MRTNLIKYFTLLLFIVAISGCFNSPKKNIPDVSKVKINTAFQRFDLDFSTINKQNYDSLVPILKEKYPYFFEDFSDKMMGFGMPENPKDTHRIDPKPEILMFNSDTFIQKLYQQVAVKFAKPTYEDELQKALTFYAYYFPEKPITNVITFVSLLKANERGFGAMTYGDSTLGIALDMYLGDTNSLYKVFEYPEYLHRKFTPQYITPNCLEVLYMLNFSANTTEYTNLEAMVEAGKLFYFIENMMPNAHDSLVIGYTESQVKWCDDNKKEIWKFLNEKDLLLKNNYLEQKRLVNDAPTTAGMPAEAPGRVGAWVGWQIVRKYAAENPTVSLKQIIKNTDAKTIIAKAKYKP